MTDDVSECPKCEKFGDDCGEHLPDETGPMDRSIIDAQRTEILQLRYTVNQIRKIADGLQCECDSYHGHDCVACRLNAQIVPQGKSL